MPENDNNQPSGDGEPQGLPEVRAALDRETKRRKEAEKQATEGAAARRELAFLRAGVDIESPVGKLFVKAYDGELEAEAIKTQYQALVPEPAQGGEEPPPSGEPAGEPPPTGMPTDDAARLAAARAQLQSNASPPGSEPQTHVGQAMMDAAFEAQQGQRARPSGGFGPKARDAGLDALFNRAMQGDSEAVFKRPDENWGDATERWRAEQ